MRECESVCLSVVVHALITGLRELCAGECTLPWAVPECPHVEQCCGFFNSLHPRQARRHTLDHKAQGNTYRAIKIRSNVASCLFIEVNHNTSQARASDCRRVRPVAAGRLANTTRALAAACRAHCPTPPRCLRLRGQMAMLPKATAVLLFSAAVASVLTANADCLQDRTLFGGRVQN